MSYCLTCGSMIDEWDSAYYARTMLCIPCYDRKSYVQRTVSCAKCGMGVRQDEGRRKSGGVYCNYCASELERLERIPKCPVCRLPVESWQKSVKTPKGETVHASCEQSAAGHATVCNICGRKKNERMRLTAFGKPICALCLEERRKDSQRATLASFVDRIGAMIG